MSKQTDFSYYRKVVNTQTDGEILNSELNDLIREAEAEVNDLRTENADLKARMEELEHEKSTIEETLCGLLGLKGEAERKLTALERKIIHCDNCGGTWYDDGFTACCPKCQLTALVEGVDENAERIYLDVYLWADKETQENLRGPLFAIRDLISGENKCALNAKEEDTQTKPIGIKSE